MLGCWQSMWVCVCVELQIKTCLRHNDSWLILVGRCRLSHFCSKLKIIVYVCNWVRLLSHIVRCAHNRFCDCLFSHLNAKQKAFNVLWKFKSYENIYCSRRKCENWLWAAHIWMCFSVPLKSEFQSIFLAMQAANASHAAMLLLPCQAIKFSAHQPHYTRTGTVISYTLWLFKLIIGND